MTQSVAILKTLCMEHGYAPQNPSVMYETEWFHGMMTDVMEKPARVHVKRDDATPEEIAECIALLNDFLGRAEARFSDGRPHAGGD